MQLEVFFFYSFNNQISYDLIAHLTVISNYYLHEFVFQIKTELCFKDKFRFVLGDMGYLDKI